MPWRYLLIIILSTYNLLWKYHRHNIFFVKILRYLVVVAIFLKILNYQFFTSQNKILKVPIGLRIVLGIVFWFGQVFGLILMLLKNLSYLFKAFRLSGEIDFFSSQVQQFVFVSFYIILSIYIKSECLKVTVILVCSTCIVLPTTFFFFECVKLK